MATNDTKINWGAEQTVISLAASLANGSNTYSGLGSLTMTPFDNTGAYMPRARASLMIPDTFGAAPTAGSTVDLYMTLQDIDSTNDETPVPASGSIIYQATKVGQFVVGNADVALRKWCVFDIDFVEKADFYILNNSGQTLTYTSSPIVVKIRPYTFAPA